MTKENLQILFNECKSWIEEKKKVEERQKLRSDEIAELRSRPDSPLEDDEHIIYYCEDCIILILLYPKAGNYLY